MARRRRRTTTAAIISIHIMGSSSVQWAPTVRGSDVSLLTEFFASQVYVLLLSTGTGRYRPGAL
uniref:Uncharacterized protein n=1 Tax=Anguilla anguilla TaxID=7936 RepID=A0A0E9XNM9_ANGAN